MPAPQASHTLGLHAGHAQEIFRVRQVGRQLRQLGVELGLEQVSTLRPIYILHGSAKKELDEEGCWGGQNMPAASLSLHSPMQPWTDALRRACWY